MRDLPNLANRDYVDRVNRAIDFVTTHLASPLRLEDVARAAGFSSYHFHRIFRGLMGETLAAFVRRVRLERAVYLMSHRKGASLTEIAFACGFASSSDFSRAFRAHHGVPPRQFDAAGFRTPLRPRLLEEMPIATALQANPDGFAVTLRDLPARRVAYIRVHRPYGGNDVLLAVNRLLAWAEARGLADGQWLGYQWEDPEIVPRDKCRYDVGVEVPETVRADGQVSVTEFSPFRVAEVEIKGSIDVELRALHWLFFAWLPTSDYAPAHQPMFEAWNGRPFAHGMEHFELRAQLPVVGLDVPL